MDKSGEYKGIKKHDTKEDAWVNACSMILEARAFQYFQHPTDDLINCLAQNEAVQTYRHEGFWSLVETIRDKRRLEYLWLSGQAPWKVWDD